MVCIHCGNETQVINSRPQKRTNRVWRRRKCLKCFSIVSTDEIVDFATALRVRSDSNRLTPLLRDKLFLSLHKSLGHRKTAVSDASGLCATILSKVTLTAVDGVVSSQAIAQATVVALLRFDPVAATHYQAFHRDR